MFSKGESSLVGGRFFSEVHDFRALSHSGSHRREGPPDCSLRRDVELMAGVVLCWGECQLSYGAITVDEDRSEWEISDRIVPTEGSELLICTYSRRFAASKS